MTEGTADAWLFNALLWALCLTVIAMPVAHVLQEATSGMAGDLPRVRAGPLLWHFGPYRQA